MDYAVAAWCVLLEAALGNAVGSGARESAGDVGWFWLLVRLHCGLPLSPLMQGSVFFCLTVLFSSGDLEVSNSAIQIHCVRYTLPSNPPISPLLLTLSCLPTLHFFLFFALLPSSRLFFSQLSLFSLITCLILFVLFSRSSSLFLCYLITSPQASLSLFFSHSFFPYVFCHVAFSFSLLYTKIPFSPFQQFFYRPFLSDYLS